MFLIVSRTYDEGSQISIRKKNAKLVHGLNLYRISPCGLNFIEYIPIVCFCIKMVLLLGFLTKVNAMWGNSLWLEFDELL